MKVLFAASECTPIAKVGGLADVIGALPKALKSLNVDVSIALPFYEMVKIEKNKLELAEKDIRVFFNQRQETFNLWKAFLPNSKVPVLLIENKEYFSGKGVYVESDASSGGSEKEAARFIFLSTAAIETAKIIKADILHCHDWHVGITPFLIKKENERIKTLLTIHNLGYQGLYAANIINRLLHTDFKEKEVNCLKLGILNADFINAVSPSYSQEILTAEYGECLENYLNQRKENLTGILNGIDYDHFSPETDIFLQKNYSQNSIEDKTHNKSYLQKRCFKKDNLKIPVLGIVSRLAKQKGIDLIKEIFPELMKENMHFILLGAGSAEYEDFFKKASENHKEKFWCKIGFDEELAHQIYGASDIFLMPSAFEPCGLGQQVAMKYGTVPVARATGGIKDTVFPIDIENGKTEGTGFLFEKYEGKEFLRSIKEALNLYQNKEIWRKIQINCMKKDFTWKKSAKKYKLLYEKILKLN